MQRNEAHLIPRAFHAWHSPEVLFDASSVALALGSGGGLGLRLFETLLKILFAFKAVLRQKNAHTSDNHTRFNVISIKRSMHALQYNNLGPSICPSYLVNWCRELLD